MTRLPAPTSFDWDEGNRDKNWKRHKVHFKEAEEIFFNKPLKTFSDIRHSDNEKRFVAFGFTNRKRQLTIIFTVRTKKLRVISAREQNRKERSRYEKD